jgi:hypothetical protein
MKELKIEDVKQECIDVLSYLIDDGFTCFVDGHVSQIDICINKSGDYFDFEEIEKYIIELENHLNDYGFRKEIDKNDGLSYFNFDLQFPKDYTRQVDNSLVKIVDGRYKFRIIEFAAKFINY